MARTRAIRHRLLSIVLLGALTSMASVAALVRAITTMSRTSRIERTHDMLNEELDRLVRSPPSATHEPATGYVGVRGGVVEGAGGEPGAPIPFEWRETIARAAAQAAERRARVFIESELGPSTLVVAAAPADGRLDWVGYLVQPSSLMRPWRWIVGALALATALLVATTLLGIRSFRRSAKDLHGALEALGKDLSAPVPRPGIVELEGIAGGIRGLAAELVASRAAAERLSRELALKERLAALGRIAAGIAHEVRNPLASIKLRLDLAAAHALPEATAQSLAAASDEIARLDRLVSDLLLVAGRKLGERRETDLGALLRARAFALGPWATEHAVALAVDGEGAAFADPESVARAVDNLLRNAVEASPRGATVAARVVPNGSTVEVRVEDRGGGVAAARVPELFEPFFTTKSEGTGLGLAISRAIARAHGGDLDYRRDGDVTRFSLTLPKREVA